MRCLNKIITAFFFSTICSFVVYGQNTVKPNVKVPNGFEVNSFTGNLYHQRADMKMPSQGLPLEIIFSFNNTQRGKNQGYGNGWTFTYNIYYATDTNGIFIYHADGGRDFFVKNAGLYKAPVGVFDTLVEYQSAKFRLDLKEGTSYFFDNSTHKKITKITDRNSNNINISYTDSLPAAITDAAGRFYTLSWASGKLMEITNACSAPVKKILFTYDAKGSPVKVTNPAGGFVKYFYDSSKRIIGYSDENANNMSIIYNANGAVSKIVSCATTHLFTYSPALRKTFVTEQVNGQRQITTYSYDTTGRILHKEGNCCGYNLAYKYDAANNISEQTNGNNQAVKFEYDAKGNVTKETDAQGNFNVYTWHSVFNKLLTHKDKRGNTTTYEYDANGNQTKITRPLSTVEQATYDSKGNILTQIDANLNVTTYEYNNFGQLTKTTDPLNGVVMNVYDGCGNLAETKDARNNSTYYEYDALNRITKTTNALGNITTYTFDASGNLTSVKDALNRTATYTYDGLGRRINSISPSGFTNPVEYDERGNRIKVTDANGNSTVYTYNNRNQVITETDALGRTKSYDYDGVGNLISETDKRGNTTQYEYNSLNQLIKVNNADGKTATMGYDATGNKIIETDLNGNNTFYEYSVLNRMVKTTDAAGKTMLYTYDDNGNTITMVDKNGNSWATQFDRLNRAIKTISTNTATTEITYDANGNRTSVKDPLGHISASTYDALNRVITELNSLTEATTYTYDAVGNSKTVTYPNGNTITNTYNNDNRLVSVADAIGSVVINTYDGKGNKLTEKDANNNTTTYTYDALNRRIKLTDAMGFFSAQEYDANGNTTKETDRNSKSKLFEYDKLNRRIKETDALGNSTTFLYDGNGNLTHINDAKNNSTGYTYNNLNRLVRETFADGTTKDYAYDANGNRKTRKDNAGIITTYTYDNVNQLTQRSYPGGINETFSYDLAGRRLTANNANATITFTYDNTGRILSETLNGHTTAYAYNTSNRIRVLTYPGGRIITEQRDLRDRLINVSEVSANIAQFNYDGADRLLSKALGNGYNQNYVYDANSRITGLDCQPGNVLNFQYSYDNEGNKLTAVKNHRPTHSEKYLYDNIYQLTGFYNGRFVGINFTDTTSKSNYSYDALHNRINSMEDTVSRIYTANKMNAYTTVSSNGIHATYTYDLNGNTLTDGTNTYQYDYENRQTAIVGTAQYQYDALGRKIKITSGATIANHLYDGNRIIEEINSANATVKTFVFGRWIDELLNYYFSGIQYFISNNSQGDILVAFESNFIKERYDYSTFGNTRYFDNNFIEISLSQIDNNILFKGRTKQLDFNYDFRNRNYSIISGRFIQRDPLGYVDGFNLYAAYFIPNSIDPFGLESGCESCFRDNPSISNSAKNCESFYDNPCIVAKTSFAFRYNAKLACKYGDFLNIGGDKEKLAKVRKSLQDQYKNLTPKDGKEFSPGEHKDIHDKAYKDAGCNGSPAAPPYWYIINYLPSIVPINGIDMGTIAIVGGIGIVGRCN